MDRKSPETSGPAFDEKLAAPYVGKYIIVGIIYLDHAGQEIRRQQIHGKILSASQNGIMIGLKGVHDGETWNMPPDLRSIRKAKPGRYRLRETDEVVEDPDFLAEWTRTAPPPKASTQYPL